MVKSSSKPLNNIIYLLNIKYSKIVFAPQKLRTFRSFLCFFWVRSVFLSTQFYYLATNISTGDSLVNSSKQVYLIIFAQNKDHFCFFVRDSYV